MSNRMDLKRFNAVELFLTQRYKKFIRVGLLATSRLQDKRFTCGGIVFLSNDGAHFMFPVQIDLPPEGDYPESYFESVVGFSDQPLQEMSSVILEFAWGSGRWIMINPEPIIWLGEHHDDCFEILRLVTQTEMIAGEIVEFVLNLGILGPSGSSIAIEAAPYSASILLAAIS